MRVSPIGQVPTDTPLLTEPSPVDPDVHSNEEGGPDKAKRVG